MRNKEGFNIFKKLAFVVCLLFGLRLYAQTPSVYPAVSLTAANATTSAIPLGSGFSTCNVSVTITGTGTGTIQVIGSTDGGVTYYPMNISALLTPGNVSTTETITGAGVYQTNCGGFTHLKFATTSASFTLTSVIFTLTGAPNTQISRAVGVVPALNNAACLAASAPIQSPCQAYYQAFTGLGNGGGTGTITLYSNNAPAGTVLHGCQHIWINTPVAGGEIYAFPAYTTPGGSTVGAVVALQTTSAVPTFATFGNSCFDFALGTNSSFTYNNVESGTATGLVWETEIVFTRVN